MTTEDIAKKYEISIRTVYRDIRALEEIGVPVYFENQKGYTIIQGFFLPPVSLTTEEANALILMAALSEKFADSSIKKHINNALDKIKSVLRTTEKEKVSLLQSQIKIYEPEKEADHSEFLTEIQNAIVNRQVLAIEYINNQEERSLREVEPIGLKFYSSQWHMIAWCWERQAYRDFKVKQIINLENNNESFRKKNHYDLNDYMESLK